MIEQRVETWRDQWIWWAACNGIDATGPTESIALAKLKEKLRECKA